MPLLDKLKYRHNISTSTLSAILGCSQNRIWKFERRIRPLPLEYLRKLKKFLAFLEEKNK